MPQLASHLPKARGPQASSNRSLCTPGAGLGSKAQDMHVYLNEELVGTKERSVWAETSVSHSPTTGTSALFCFCLLP